MTNPVAGREVKPEYEEMMSGMVSLIHGRKKATSPAIARESKPGRAPSAGR